MPRARVPTRVLACLFAMIVGAGVAVAEKPAAGNPVATTQHSPNEFGTQDYTVTTIGAVSFTPASNDNSVDTPYVTYSFFRYAGNPNHTHYYATVSIPSGAVIDFVGLESYCQNAPAVVGVQLSLVDRYGTVTSIVGFSCTQHDNAASDYNATPVGFQLVENAHSLLVLDVEINEVEPNFGYFGWVEVWWKRAVSPPPAVASFDDVPLGSQYSQFIEALKAGGITAGCQQNPPLYCPDRPITRAEMATYLSKALGLHWPN